MPTGRHRRAARAAFTFLEVIVVLVILSMLTAMAIPSVRGMLDDRKLRSAGELIRATWNSARSDAMTTGQILLFRYQPESRNYRLTLWTGSDAANEMANAGPTSFTVGSGQEGPMLPEGIVFVSGNTLSDGRAQHVISEVGAIDTGPSMAAPPVLFYPDGSTTTAELVIAHERGQAMSVTMRGLTGVTSLSPLFPFEGARDSERETPQ